MMNYSKVLSVITIITLVVAVFFVFGVHELNDHFCPINASTGICGLLGSLTQIIDHIFSMNVFLVLVLPVFIGFLTAFLFYERFLLRVAPVEFYNPGLLFITPKVEVSEFRWLRRHINSPTL